MIGQSVARIEDEALLRGKGRFVDDIRLPHMLEAAFVRSPQAHARILSIDAEAARALPGVHAVLTLDELRPYVTSDQLLTALPSPSYRMAVDRPILALHETVHVGEAIAIVVADDRYIAEDAAELVQVEYEPLDVVNDCRDALRADAPPCHTGLSDNLLADYATGFGDIDAAFQNAPRSLRRNYWIARGGSHSIEGRGAVARYDSDLDRLDVWISTQTPNQAQRILCSLLGMGDEQVRVITPDIGGAFGPKLVFYPEEAVISIASRILKRPVKWIEDRREHFVATTQERDQHWDAEVAFDDAGRILGLRGTLIHDHGAYNVRGVNVPVGSTSALTLAYDIPAYRIDVKVALTNKVAVSPVRGAGQPQGVFVMERLLDEMARELRLDRAEVRRINLIKPESMPYSKRMATRGGIEIVLDSGDYPACQAATLAKADWDGFAIRKARALADGRHIGIGMANYVESTGRGPYESVRMRIGRDGRILVATGAVAFGQGTQTMLAQIIADQLPGNYQNIAITAGDTQAMPDGIGTFNSRQTVMSGSSAHLAAKAIKQKLFDVAKVVLGVSAEDLKIDGPRVCAVSKGTTVSFGELALQAAGLPGFKLPGGSPGLEVQESFVADPMTYTNGTAVAEVEVDVRTGHVAVLKVTLGHDCGAIINPRLVDGQIVGGVVHGLGNSLYERMIYDEGGQPLTTNLGDYLLVTATEAPPVDLVHLSTPSTLNPLGVKGVGESGTIPMTAAIASAIEDALSQHHVYIRQAPISPPELADLIIAAGQPSVRLEARAAPISP